MRENLKPIFEKALKLYVEGDKLYAEVRKLLAEGDKLYGEGDKLRAEGDKLYGEGDKLWHEGNKLWKNAVYKEYGKNAKITWLTNYKCQVNNDIYGEFDGNDILKDLCSK